jgi:tRNA-specific 2-thiouridylase
MGVRMPKKVLVAMSGGVDSSVASLLLKDRGYDVAGVTMRLGIKDGDGRKPRCCSVQAIEDARNVCAKLGIPHDVMDFSKELQEGVVNNFISEYSKGRTPNPCIDCNKQIKFGILLKRAISLGFDFLATGHYARIKQNGNGNFLKIPKDKIKDQTYFLYMIKRELLSSVLFPLAGLTKQEVRAIASRRDLPVADKPASQDICFIRESDCRVFLMNRIKGQGPGPIVNLKGEILGEHRGIAFYTVGQREGLGISHKRPLYIISLDADKNKIVVGEEKELTSSGLVIGGLNLLVGRLPKQAFVKIRYGQKKVRCRIWLRGDKLKLIFKKRQKAVTPGQSAVLYNQGVVLGGGIIEEALGGYN